MMSTGTLPKILSWTHLKEAAEYAGSEQSRQAQTEQSTGSEQSRQAQSRADTDRLRADQKGSKYSRQAQSRVDRLRAEQTGLE